MVKAYNEKKCSEIQFCSWMIASLLPGNDLIIKKIDDMDGRNENWIWSNSDKSHQTCSSANLECWGDSDSVKCIPLEPPLEFQDNPIEPFIEKFAINFISKLISEAFMMSSKITWSIPCSQVCHMSDSLPLHNSVLWNSLRLCWTPELLPNSKHPSALSACLSISHNSLSTISSSNIDVSDHIKSAISHDVLSNKQISDVYNVPFDSDIYAVPVDVVQDQNSKKSIHREKYCHSSDFGAHQYMFSMVSSNDRNSSQKLKKCSAEGRGKGLLRRSRLASTTSASVTEPIHVTVDDVRQYLKALYVNSNEVVENKNLQDTLKNFKNPFKSLQINSNHINNEENRLHSLKARSNSINVAKIKKAKENVEGSGKLTKLDSNEKLRKWTTCRPSLSASIKETLCNIFRIKKLPSPNHCMGRREIGVCSDEVGIRLSGHENLNPPSPITKPPFSKRALPPLPRLDDDHGEIIVTDSTPLPSPEEVTPSSMSFRSRELPASVDFASSIEKVKDVSLAFTHITYCIKQIF